MAEARELAAAQPPEPDGLSAAQVASLAQLVGHPGAYVQRCVEELAFLPDGGQHWTRKLQIRLPPLSDGSAAEEGWRVLSLGTFEPKRYADITATDRAGQPLAFVTREMHGSILAKVLLHQYTSPLLPAEPAASNPRLEELETAALTELSSFLLLHDGPGELASSLDAVLLAFSTYLVELQSDPDAMANIGEAFGAALAKLNPSSQYLCWIKGADNEIVSTVVSYSTSDAWRGLAGQLDDYERIDWARLRGSLRDPSRAVVPELCSLIIRWWQANRMGVYRQFGAAPLNYVVGTPVSDTASSYYFMLRPPPKTTAALICDADGIHSRDGGVDAAAISFHMRIGSKARQVEPPRLRAYIRPERREHKTIAAGAFLNLVFVFLVSRGRFNNSLDTQTWILITPTLLTGIIAQQQRHYYAVATRRQRAVLWVYLALGTTFLVVVTFSKSYFYPGSGTWGWAARLVFILFGMASTFVAVTYASFGALFLRLGDRWMLQKRSKAGVRTWTGADAKTHYEEIVLRFCDRTLLLAILLSVLVGCLGVFMSVDHLFKATQEQVAPVTPVSIQR